MTHEKIETIPDWAKTALTIFNRAGFPAVAFGVMAYLCFITLEKQTKVISEFKEVLIEVKHSLENNTETNKRMIEAIYRTRAR